MDCGVAIVTRPNAQTIGNGEVSLSIAGYVQWVRHVCESVCESVCECASVVCTCMCGRNMSVSTALGVCICHCKKKQITHH